MNYYIYSNRETLDMMAANEIKKVIDNNPNSVLGFATGSTPLGIYKQLIKMNHNKEIDFSSVKTYNLDEYAGLSKNHPSSYNYYMTENLFKHINIPAENYHLPDGSAPDLEQECARYEKRIIESGGIDIQVLGIGHNGHIGFNEPGTPFDACTHIVDLDVKTIEANSRFFKSREEVPKQALSMGIKTIMKARQIILVVIGEDKAEIIKKALLGPVTPEVPASILQLHPNVSVFLDNDAAAEIPSHLYNRHKTMQFTPAMIPVLDRAFRPASLENRLFRQRVEESGKGVPLNIALERSNGLISTYNTMVFSDESEFAGSNLFYVERLIKTLLWAWGGWKLTIGGPASIGRYIKKIYAAGALRDFDRAVMERIYEKTFTVVLTDPDHVPEANEQTRPVGRHLEGCRIGFDAGGSDRKVSAVIDGEVVYSEEVIWHPKLHSNPEYHYNGIMESLKTAASHLPRVDAIGVSSAGVYIDNRVMIASLFLKVPEEQFNRQVKNMFFDIQQEMGGVPIEVANDGDVTALAGAMDLDQTNVLGIAMGTSEAGGFVDGKGNITGWLNELAFIPVDYNPDAMVDEWSGDFGCGVKYFSQDAVIKLASTAGIKLDEKLSPAEKLKVVQDLMSQDDDRAQQIFQSIGCYLGYGIAYYADFYDIKHILILGRVTSGKGGNTILRAASEVLEAEFPMLAKKITLHLPDESSRRVGQSIAAASLPEIKVLHKELHKSEICQ